MPRSPEFPSSRVFLALKEKIESGELAVGEQLPSMDTIARDYQVSRTTARKAVQALADDGLVEIKPRWGTFVR